MSPRRRSAITRATAGAAVLAACVGRGPAAAHQSIGPDFEPLRSRFQADSGKVRAILLASPT